MIDIRLRTALAAVLLALIAAVLSASPVVAAPAAAGAPRLTADQPVPPAELEALVDGVVRRGMERDQVAGVTVSVVQDGKVVLKKGYGYADIDRRRPVDPDRTLFRVGSISKTFTWLMALNAVERGHMSLDAPINSYLPPKVRVPNEGFTQQISMRNLMTHTPGFEDLPLNGLFLRDPTAIKPLDDYLASRRPARVRPPGEMHAYSNYGAALAGAAVAHAEGQPWQDLLESEILKPAGMDHTTGREPYPARPGLPAPMPQALAADLSLAYRWTGAGYAVQPFEYVNGAPAGAISSTAADMARYATLLLNGGKLDGRTLYGPATAATLRTPFTPLMGGTWLTGGFVEGTMPGGYPVYFHNGASIATNASLNLFPAQRLGVFTASNTEGGVGLVQTLGSAIADRFYGPPTPPPLPPSPSLMRDAAAYTGEFQSNQRPFHGLARFLWIFQRTKLSVASPGYLMFNGLRFVPTGQSGGFQYVDRPASIRLSLGFRHARVETIAFSPAETYERVRPLYQTGTLADVALLAVAACVAVLFGLFSPARWRAPQTRTQRIAGSFRGLAAGIWLVAVVAFAMKAQAALADHATAAYGWPGPLMLTASGCALIAAALSGAAAALTPFAWAARGGWNAWRKLRFTATVLVFLTFSLLLAILGALQPWNP
jgi:CubicO group peptidase (beta-lactamase class C family)